MPTLDQNMEMWNRRHDWSRAGDEWSDAWGDSASQWQHTILPRIQSYLPANTVLEIAPGHGRWTQFLVDQCQALVLVDLSDTCLRACRERFGTRSHVTYHVNDGKSLAFVPDASIDFAFSFDSLVHVEGDVIAAYAGHLARVLTDHGVAFIHHSNLGEYAGHLALLDKLPSRLLRLLARWRVLEGPDGNWRATGMSAGQFETIANAAGLRCIGQELVNWHGTRLSDCFSLVTRAGSRWARANLVIRNADFMREAARVALQSPTGARAPQSR